MRMIAGSSWGAHPDSMLLLFKSAIRSILEYGSFAFRHMAKTHQLKLKRIQWRALRTSLGLMTSTHTGTLEVLSGIQPLDIRWKQQADKYLLKAHSSPSEILHQYIEIHKKIAPQQLTTAIQDCIHQLDHSHAFPCYSFPFISTVFTPVINWTIRNSIANVIDPSAELISGVFAETIHHLQPIKTVFTDGSKSNFGTGAAYYVDVDTQEMLRLREPATIFDAELIAIEMATLFIKSQPSGKYVIASDSMSAIQALSISRISTKSSMTLYRCRHLLYDLSNANYSITVMWVPAHRGIVGNERADEFAKKSTTSENIGIHPQNPPWQNYVPSLKNENLLEWQHRWNTGDLGRFCYSIVANVQFEPWYVKFDQQLQRAVIRTICRIVANHYCLNQHLNRFQIKESPLCTRCGGYENVDHVLFDCPCPSLVQHRPQLHQHLQSTGFTPPYTTRDLLALSTSSIVPEALHDFITCSNISI